MKAKQKKKQGRPIKHTPKMIRRVSELAALGMTQRQICTIVNVNECTLSTWKTTFPKINKAIEKGTALGIERRLKRIEKAGKRGSWQADAWQLERRNPDQFAKRFESTGVGGGPIEVEDKTPIKEIPRQRLREIVAMLNPEKNGE